MVKSLEIVMVIAMKDIKTGWWFDDQWDDRWYTNGMFTTYKWDIYMGYMG